MKSKIFTIALALVVIEKSFAQNTSDVGSYSKNYFDIFGYYGFGVIDGTNGQGMTLGGSFGHSFTKKISCEVGFSHLLGSTIKTSSYFQDQFSDQPVSGNTYPFPTYTTTTISDEATSRGRMTYLEGAVKISLGTTIGKRLEPYIKFGIIYGIAKVKETSQSVISRTEVYPGHTDHSISGKREDSTLTDGSCFGFKGSFGGDYSISKLITVFLGAQLIAITSTPDKAEWTTAYDSGSGYGGSVSQKQSLDAMSSRTKYQLGFSDHYPMGSIGLTAGIKFKVGAANE